MTSRIVARAVAVLSAFVLWSAAHAGLAPVHSWRTLPVYLHSSNRSGMWNETALSILAKYPMVVIEKWHCQGALSSEPYAPPAGEPCAQLTQEERMIRQCEVLKQRAPKLSCIFYMNAAIDFEWYQLHQTMLRNEDAARLPDWALRYQNGSFVELTSRQTFNFANQSMADEFAATCSRAIATGSVDGCFVDRSDPVWQTDNWGRGTPPGDFISLADYTKQKIRALRAMQAAAGAGPVIMNCHSCIDNRQLPPIGAESYTHAQNIEWFRNTNDSINDMLFLRKHAKLVRAHGDNKNFTDLVGAFLIAAGDNCFFGYGGFWEAPAWMNFYDVPIGDPQGEAIYERTTGIWRRDFEHVSVTFDTGTNRSTIVNRTAS